MRINTTEYWKYAEYSVYEVEALPEGWDEWSVNQKYDWTVENAEYVEMSNDPIDLITVTDVEVY